MNDQQNVISKYKLLFILTLLPLLFWLSVLLFFKAYIPFFSPFHGITPLLMLLLISPTLEEVVFRGLFQDLFLHYLHNPLICILLLNIAFAVIHYRVNHSPLYVFSVFASGVVFSCVKLKYKKLIFPIGLHIYYNFVYIVVLSFVLQ